MSTTAHTHRRYEPGPEVESLNHLRGCELAGRACDGMACFVARNSRGEAHPCGDPRVKAGEFFATFHAGETGLNRLTGQGRDKQAMTPEYKVVAVRIDRNGGDARNG